MHRQPATQTSAATGIALWDIFVERVCSAKSLATVKAVGAVEFQIGVLASRVVDNLAGAEAYTVLQAISKLRPERQLIFGKGVHESLTRAW